MRKVSEREVFAPAGKALRRRAEVSDQKSVVRPENENVRRGSVPQSPMTKHQAPKTFQVPITNSTFEDEWGTFLKLGEGEGAWGDGKVEPKFAEVFNEGGKLVDFGGF